MQGFLSLSLKLSLLCHFCAGLMETWDWGVCSGAVGVGATPALAPADGKGGREGRAAEGKLLEWVPFSRSLHSALLFVVSADEGGGPRDG